MKPIRSGKIEVLKNNRSYFSRGRAIIFLWVKFRMAIISNATFKIIINSSYVLIITTPFVRPPKRMESILPSCPGKYIKFSLCPPRLLAQGA